jgi:hypothetical protein
MKFWGRSAVTIGMLIAVVVIITGVVWLVTDDDSGDFVADFMTDKRGCTDVARETISATDLGQPGARDLGEQAEELTELRCLPDGPSMILIRFSSDQAAQQALGSARGRVSTLCGWDNVVLVPGPYSTNDTIDACAHRPMSAE